MIKPALRVVSWIGLFLVFGWYLHTSWLLRNRPQFPDPDHGLDYRLAQHGSSVFVGQHEIWLHQFVFPVGFLMVAAGVIGEQLRIRRKTG